MISCLHAQIDRLAHDRILWIAPDARRITAGELKNSIARDVRSLLGKRVVVAMDSPLAMAHCLATLDGICEAILLLPSDIPDNLRKDLVEQAGVTTCVSESDVVTWEECDSQTERTVATRWILATSGTTGIPKLIEHSLASLTRTASFDLSIGSEHTWSSLYNLTGFAGLQVFLQAWCGGSPFVMHDEASDLSSRIQRMAAEGVTALSATPTMWRKIMMSGHADAMQLRRITLGGEIADQKILDALALTYPNARITQIYASTEAGVGFSVKDGKAGFPTSYLDHPPKGVRLQIRDGRLYLKNEQLKQRIVDKTSSLFDDTGFLDTGDRVERNGDRIEFLGRANGAINVGGNKVQPEEVERVLTDFAGVLQAKVYAKKNAFTGSLVAADVVLDENSSQDGVRKDLMLACRDRLEAFKVPAIIRLVDALETNAAGKLRRSA